MEADGNQLVNVADELRRLAHRTMETAARIEPVRPQLAAALARAADKLREAAGATG